MEFLLSLAMTGGTRFTIRALRRVAVYAEADDDDDPSGAAVRRRTGANIARSAMREPKAGVQPVGFLDDDLRRKGQEHRGRAGPRQPE
jgi:FlaA1/EpsC-like NDP-sugar epimerase